jgi:hypothetical protein
MAKTVGGTEIDDRFDKFDVTEEAEFERVHKNQPCPFCGGRLRLADCLAARVFEYTETANSRSTKLLLLSHVRDG